MQAISCFFINDRSSPALFRTFPFFIRYKSGMSAIIRVNHLSKSFGDIKAVDDLSFTVSKGGVHGFLGQNGKSTTIRMLLTLIRPTAGSIELFGLDLRRHRREILRRTGAMIEKPDLYKYLSAYENLRIFARLSGVSVSRTRTLEQLEHVGLADRAHSKVRTFSQGMKQRLGLACALVHDPELIILDEPTNGLDPQGISDMRSMILQLSRKEGKTLLVSSHLLAEMELVADHLLIIHKGRKVIDGSVQELLRPDRVVLELKTLDPTAAQELLADSRWQNGLLPPRAETVRIEVPNSDIPELHRHLVQQGLAVTSLRPVNSLEDYFLSLTQE
jgi:ABC-type multidrug transport system ATPase subunit